MPRSRPLRAEMMPPPPPRAEIHVRPRRIIVMIPLAELGLENPRILLTPTSIRIRSATSRDGQEFIVPLPEPINPREYRARVSNGILDVVAHRLGRTRILSTDSFPER